jgi:hypothetical protein
MDEDTWVTVLNDSSYEILVDEKNQCFVEIDSDEVFTFCKAKDVFTAMLDFFVTQESPASNSQYCIVRVDVPKDAAVSKEAWGKSYLYSTKHLIPTGVWHPKELPLWENDDFRTSVLKSRPEVIQFCPFQYRKS